MRPRTIYELFRDAGTAWSEDKAPRLGAALAYYSVFSIAPLLVIAIAIAGVAFGREAAEGQVVATLRDLLGRDGAEAVHAMLERANQPAAGLMASLFGVGMMLLGASGVFGQLKDALNTVWGVAPRPGNSLMGTVRERFFSITMVLGTGFLLLVSLVVSAAISALATWASGVLPGMDALWQAVNLGVGFGVTAALFALLFRYVPDAIVAWRDVWAGALVTAALFSVGKYVLGVYLATSSLTTPFGAAGSLVILLLWVYWSSQIVLYGAEFTKVWAERFGGRIRPDAGAVRVTADDRAREGLTALPSGSPSARGTPAPSGPPPSPGRRS